MNLISTSRLPGKTLGNLAFAGSLALHAGFFALYSSWQWDWTTLPKNPPKVVKVKFLPPSKVQKKSPAPAPTTRRSPTQPAAMISSSAPALTARIPKLSEPTPQPGAQAKQVHVSSATQVRTRNIQRVSSPTERTQPHSAQSIQLLHQNQNSRHASRIRPAPVLDTFSTASVRPIQPARIQSTGRQTLIRHRTPLPSVVLSNTPASISQSPRAMVSLTNERDAIHPHPAPDISQAIFSAKTSPAVQRAIESVTSSLTPRVRSAALPTKSFQNSPPSGNVSEARLNSVRGVFAGKVRQRIAESKYYPGIAKRRGMEGQPVVAFTLSKRGGLLKADLAETSGYRLLDQAALEAVQQAAPYPEIPAELKTETYHFKLPISFVLK